ncbi:MULTISPECIES: FUSC family protein [unclassified Streptomyces]|uniref:FUSC family protein n=1 Tax=unclassified Streptomyces TaxID=2593676 RepID=UPI0006B04ABC|nr:MULTISPECIES: aromatic acid exporter family protein [unclassified Streptomyces]
MSEKKNRAGDWCRSRWHTARTSLADAVRGPGEARDGILLQAKGTAAATVAWCLSSWLLPANVTAFAPFTALLALQSTVYRSMWDSAQYLAAMAIGTAVAAGFGSTVGVHAWTLCVLVFVALAVVRLDLLGGQGAQVPVVALFAFAGGGGRIDYIGPLVASAAIGVCCGLAAHFAFAPSPHPARARRRVEELTADAQTLLRDLARTAEGKTEGEDVREEDWPRRCEELAARAARARAALGREQENARLNPRRSWDGEQGPLRRCHETVDMIERIGTHVRSIARALTYEPRCPSEPRRPFEASVSAEFAASYAELLHATAEGLEHLAPPGGPEDPAGLRRRVEGAERRYAEVVAATRSDRPGREAEWPVHGTVLVEAARILEEIKHTADLEPL